eukprot:12222299-Alexandrium_andersonii.AAC.1
MRRACPKAQTTSHDLVPSGIPTPAQLRRTATPGSTPSSVAARTNTGPMGSWPSTHTHSGVVAAGGQIAMAAGTGGGAVGPAKGTGRSTYGMFRTPATGS